MKQIAALIVSIGLTVTPAVAQDTDPGPEVEEGFSLIEEGAKMLMRGLMSEMEPAIEDLRGSLEQIAPVIGEFAREVGPSFAELLAKVDDFRNYDAPDFLPNGDIIIRRKPDAPIWIPPEGETNEIEL